jgi:hypothetical protein
MLTTYLVFLSACVLQAQAACHANKYINPSTKRTKLIADLLLVVTAHSMAIVSSQLLLHSAQGLPQL